MNKSVHFIVFSCFFLSSLNAQIYLDNPSFEGIPSDATVPVGWFPCQPKTTPDILPGPWGVMTEPSDGETFVGIISRHDGTFESIGQRLKMALSPDDCYIFSLELARSTTYAGTRYNSPLRLRVWIGETRCEKKQQIYLSDWIDNEEWETHVIKFTPDFKANYILLEAYYKDGDFSYEGNLLMDNISPIKKCVRVYLDPFPVYNKI